MISIWLLFALVFLDNCFEYQVEAITDTREI